MNAQRIPAIRRTYFGSVLHALTFAAIRRPIVMLAAAGTLAVLSVALAVLQLEFHTSWQDLLDPKSNCSQLWLNYTGQFGTANDVLVVVEAGRAEHVVSALDEIATVLTRDLRHFRHVLHQIDLSRMRAKGLYYLEPNQLETIEHFAAEAQPILSGRWTQLSVGNAAISFNSRLAMASRDPSGVARDRSEADVQRWALSVQEALSRQSRYRTPWPAAAMPVLPECLADREHFLMADGRIGIIRLQLAETPETGGWRTDASEAIAALRQHVSAIASHHPDTQIGLTGLPVMENDGLTSGQAALLVASLLSLIGVIGLFVVGLGGVRHTLLMLAGLLLAISWSFGYITVAVGHLSILSVFFIVILIALGTDYSVHYLVRYLEQRKSLIPRDEALLQTAAEVGPGILTGAVTIAAVFFATTLTGLPGLAELGIVTGGGILLCCLGTFVILPSLVRLTDDQSGGKVLPEPLDLRVGLRALSSHPGRLLCGAIVAIVLVALGMGQIRYDHNPLNLQPEGLESVRLERRLVEESGESAWFAVSLAQSEKELLARKTQFESLDSVERVDEIVSLLPDDVELKEPIIARIRSCLSDLPNRTPSIPIERSEVLDQAMAELQATLHATPQGRQIAERIQWIRMTLREIPEVECYRRISGYQRAVAEDLLGTMQLLREVSNPEPPDYTDLPEGLVARYRGAHGRHLMKIQGRGNLWEMDGMERFVQDVRSVDPKATGSPLQTYEAARETKRSYEKSGLYALMVVVALVYLSFRSLPCTVLAILPVGLGMLLLLGLLGWLREPLNPASVLVLPLILGIGVDSGVHIVHDYLRCTGRYRLTGSTATAVLITSLTAMVGFGSFMIASHRGLQSLGRVLTIGVTCCLFTSLVILPAALTWMTKGEQDGDELSIETDDPETISTLMSHTGERNAAGRMDRAA